MLISLFATVLTVRPTNAGFFTGMKSSVIAFSVGFPSSLLLSHVAINVVDKVIL
jgi:hypothetical protein